jgi:hypothetical protein
MNYRFMVAHWLYIRNQESVEALSLQGFHLNSTARRFSKTGKRSPGGSEPCATATYQIHGHEEVAVTKGMGAATRTCDQSTRHAVRTRQ